MAVQSVFHWADYLVFAVALVLSASVGVYYAIRDKRSKKNSLEEYLMGGRKMKMIPVSVSLFVSWLSAVSMLGDPVEVYYHGAIYWIIGIGYCLACPVVAHLCAERYHKMKLTSVFTFIEERFGKIMMAFSFFMKNMTNLLFTGIAIYAPSLALAQVCGIDIWFSIVGLASISTFYTFLGGMKAVLWVDTIQTAIMFLGMLTLLIRGSIVVGGISTIWTVAQDQGRINFNNFNPSPFVRSTVWTYLFGGFFRIFNAYVGSQVYIQRYCSLKTSRDAKRAIYLNIPLYAVFVSMFTLLGLLLLAYFKDCDPLLEGRITKADQMVPLMMVEVLGFMPGLSGLFMASIFSGALSTMSSIQNSMATNLLKDVLEPVYSRCTGRKLPETTAVMSAKFFCLLVGCVFVGMTSIVMYLRDPLIFQLTMKVIGAFLGPISGVFALGLLFPNKGFIGPMSAFIGCILSTALCTWWSLGANFTHVATAPTLPVNTLACPVQENTTALLVTTSASVIKTTASLPPEDSGFTVSDLYTFSPLLYGAMGIILTVLLGILFGAISKFINRKSKKLDIRQPDVYVLENKGTN